VPKEAMLVKEWNVLSGALGALGAKVLDLAWLGVYEARVRYTKYTPGLARSLLFDFSLFKPMQSDKSSAQLPFVCVEHTAVVGPS
jgi:hypothetical protein